MNSVQTGMWDPQPPSKHASPLPAPPPSTNSRLTHVTSAAPAKRITFYKSGDSQFGGIRMAIHKRSFKCFDALLDDLSQKVPLPFGVRTVTTPRGTHTIKHLEQLQDGACYLCSDQRQAKPINMELASKRPSIWYHHGRRPHRPETSSTATFGHVHLPYRQRRILLVKNSEPGIRRSVVLSRRSTRSLRAFLDEVSEVMQFHVRKLYTVEGRRIDSVQSLMTCPGVLVCVGRETFSPMLVNFMRKSSEEKTPGLGPRTPGNGARSPATQGVRSPPHGAQSRASQYSEGHESKKNVNFGLETKKSIIHPRSDSSNRSTRFSLSSEKSYGINVCSQGRPAITNDDIEKRVLVNKDGSLSVEMRVRFRLHNDESLQWSTQIKKSPSLTNECCPLSQSQPHYLQQGQSETCSDPDSASFDPEGVDYSGQQCALDGNHCPCCYQRQEQQYDLWENPAHRHKHPPHPPPHASSHTHTMVRHTYSSSSSSSCNSRRVVRCRAQLSGCGGGSGSEQSRLVQEETCVTEEVEHRVEVEQDGDTHVEVCKVSQSCSRSEVITVDSNQRPLSGKSEQELMMEEEEERPLSAVSSSSRVLQSLKEDLDDEDDDLPPSASRCYHNNEQSVAPTPEIHLNEKPTSSTFKVPEIPKLEEAANDANDANDGADKIKSAVSGLSGHTGLSASSRRSSSVCPNCGGCKNGVNSDSNGRASQRSNQASPNLASPLPNQENAANDDADSDGSAESTQSNKSNLSNPGRLSTTSNVLEGRASSARSRTSNPESIGKEGEGKRALSAAASATSHRSKRSNVSGCNSSACAEKEEERSPSTISVKSSKSHKCTTETPDIKSREETEEERTASSLSVKSGTSAKTGTSVKSHKSSCQSSIKADRTDVSEDDANKRAASCLSVRTNASAKSDRAESPDSVLSAKSNVSAKSGASHKSTSSHCAKPVSPGGKAADELIAEVTGKGEDTHIKERAGSAILAKSNMSVMSDKSHKSAKASEKSLSSRSEAGEDGEERATSQMSGRSFKSNKSVKSTHSSKSKCKGNEETAENEMEAEQRPESVMSANAESSKTHISNCHGNTGDNTEDCEKAEDRAASALSGKSASSAKSCHPNTEVEASVDRAPSAISGRSHTSAKSSKSQQSNHTAASLHPQNDDDNQERVASVMSVKSKSSLKSSTSRKSNSSTKPSNPNVTIRTPEGVDEEETETKERAPSAASGKSNVSSAVSHKSNHNHITVIETADEDEKVVDDDAPKSISSEHTRGQTLLPKRTRSPRSHSPKAPAASPTGSQSSVQQLSPEPGAGETKVSSALSVQSPTSVKSGQSKCSCGAASVKKEMEGEDKEEKENEDRKSEEASERATSIRSCSSKRQPLSQNSSGSVSLGLPEDQDAADSDSGKSSVSFQRNTESRVKGRDKTTTPVADPTLKQNRAGSTASQKSNGNSRRSASSLIIPVVDIPKIETSAGGEDGAEEGGEQSPARAANAISVKSSRSHKSCNCSLKTAAQTPNSKSSASPTQADIESESVKSASTANARNLDAPQRRTSSAMSSASAKVGRKSPASASAKNANEEKSTANNDNKEEEDTAGNKAASGKAQSPCCLRPKSATSESDSKSKASKQSEEKEAGKSGNLNPVNGHKAKSHAQSDSGSVKTSYSHKEEDHIKSSSPCPVHSPKLRSKLQACSENTLSAADLLKETTAAVRPHSQQSKASKTSGKPRSEKSGQCQRSRALKDQEEVLTPACLPNASPIEVVSDWLRSIPPNSSMLALDDALNEDDEEQMPKEAKEMAVLEVVEDQSPEDEDKEKKAEPEEEEKQDEAECDAVQKEGSAGPVAGDAVETSGTNAGRSNNEPLPRNWPSSAAVMKVLLSSSLGRCRSMPEVSPVYGRRLSTSAQGLLDCLAQLQLIEPAVNPSFDQQKDHNRQYEDIMAILHSLWLTEPRGAEVKEAKDSIREQVTPPRSSSGVGMSSGSGGSGKDNGNQGGNETPQNKTESLPEAGDKEISTEQAKTDTVDEQSTKATETSDKSSANESSKSPTDIEQEMLEDSSSSTPPTVVRAPFSQKQSQDPDPVWVLNLLRKLEKQFMSHYIDAMTEFKVRWDLDDSVILDTMICELRDEVGRRIQSSVEREMKKIQGRAGRAGRLPRPPPEGNLSRESTMMEKRRRMLKVMKNQSIKTADSVSDEEMTGDFSDQRSDDDYCPCDACVRKKMAARPLKKNPLAAEAPVMMEFDLLKILQLKKSPLPTPAAEPQPEELEGDSVAGEGVKERSLEVVQEEEEENETKEDIKAVVVLEETIAEEDEEVLEEKNEGEAREEEEVGSEKEEKEENSVSNEEQEEEGETASEEDETSKSGEEEQEEEGEMTGEEAGEDEVSKSGEEEEGETTGEEAGEDEASKSGEEEEEEEEGGCQCCARNEEDSNKEEEGNEREDAEESTSNSEEDGEGAGEEEEENAEDERETETGEEEEEEEESDNGTVKETTVGKGETTENGDGEEEEEEAKKEKEEEVSESKAEEEEEESVEDDGTAKTPANEESTLVEEFVEGNISASAEAEDEDDEDDGTGEEESCEDEKEGGSEEQEGEASEEENASSKGQEATPCVFVTEGEEADAEDSDTDSKRPSDTGAEESGVTGDEEEEEKEGEKESGGDGDDEEVEEDAVEEFKPDEDEEASGKKREDGALLHQVTRTSVESQPGSMEDVDTESHPNPVDSIEVPKMGGGGGGGGGGTGHRRSRSPARVKRRKPKECNNEVDSF